MCWSISKISTTVPKTSFCRIFNDVHILYPPQICRDFLSSNVNILFSFHTNDRIIERRQRISGTLDFCFCLCFRYPLLRAKLRAQLNVENEWWLISVFLLGVGAVKNMDSQDSHSPNRSKTSGTSNFFCRICHDEGEDLLSPCNCTGTVGLVHLSCLEKWLSTIGSQSCELCKYEFQIDCKTKSIREVYFIQH